MPRPQPSKTASRVILIGSTNRNAGKTTLALELVRRLSRQVNIWGLKVTARKGEGCHRGEHGCGVCTISSAGCVLWPEDGSHSQKDTAQMLAAGAEKAWWLRARESEIASGFEEFASLVPEDTLIVCESNALRRHIEPAIFVMMVNTGAPIKPSAESVLPLADIVYKNDYKLESLETLADNVCKSSAVLTFCKNTSVPPKATSSGSVSGLVSSLPKTSIGF
jgi:molybdopterin-guanine dinucleotide biosynthesis protein